MVDLKPLVAAAVKFAHGGDEAELRAASAAVLDAFHKVEAERDQLRAGPLVPRYSGWLWTHVVKGGDYRMLGKANLQTDKPLSDMAEVVVYQGADGKLWARERHEFEARFSRTRPDPYGVEGRKP